jgi:hypothetical protein
MNEGGEILFPKVWRDVRGLRERARFVLLLCVGLALPFYAFPVARICGREIDLATVLTGMLIVASLPELLAARFASAAFVLCAAAVPLLALVPPKPPFLSLPAFAGTYAHWLLLVFFFAAAASLRIFHGRLRILVGGQVAMGVVVSLFALYQVLGIPRGWPGTAPLLFPGQREPFRFTPIAGTGLGGGYTRPTSFFLEPAWMGGYLAWVLALCLVWRRGPGGARAGAALRFLAVLLLLCAILATVSWGAFVDLGVVLIVTFASLRERGRRSRLAIAILVGGMVVAGFALLSTPGKKIVGAVTQRWQMLRETPTTETAPAGEIKDSSWVRVRNAEHAFDLWKARPLRGVGLGQFRRYAGVNDATSLTKLAQEDPWCGWLASAAEMGILGPAILLAAMFGIFLRYRSATGGEFRPAVPVLLAVAAVQQLHTGSYVDLWWWYPLGLAAVLGRPPSPKEDPAGARLL